MEQRLLGTTGLQVSRLALGTMTWDRGTDEETARAQVHAFLDAGGNLIDTADVYADGMSERILGSILEDPSVRSRSIIATKAVSRPGTPRRFDASRQHILHALDRSLERLGVDHVDIWQMHVWDAFTPIEETLAAMDDAVRSGRVNYIGVSNYSGWQLAQAVTWQRAVTGRSPIISTQMEYSLLQRGIEREVLPAAQAMGVGILPWSPLGRGVLTAKYRHSAPIDSRASSEAFGPFVQAYLHDRNRRVVDGVAMAADGLGVSPAEVALAWVRDRPGVVSPIVGARTLDQLHAALATEELELPEEIAQALDDVSTPASGYPESGIYQRS